jgi:hypothetical protein
MRTECVYGENVSSRYGVPFEETFFQQDGARLHKTNETLDLLMSILAIVSFRIATHNVLDMDGLGHHSLLTSTIAITFYGGHLKDNVYRNNPRTVHEMKVEPESAFIGITPANFQRRLRMMLNAGGTHIVHVFRR